MTDATQPADRELQATAESCVGRYNAAMADHRLAEALAAMMDLARAANGFAESQAPWALAKAGESQRVGEVLSVMAEACRMIGHLLAPVAPSGARQVLEQLGAPIASDERGAGGPGLDALLAWGAGPADWRTGQPAPIFPRLEVAEAAT